MPAKSRARQRDLYGRDHRVSRVLWKPPVSAGLIVCPRCGRRILPGQSWDLGHSEVPGEPSKPEHSSCNRSAGGRARHRSGPGPSRVWL